MLIDDRRPSFERWLERKLDGLAAVIRQDVEVWLRTMRNGDPRTRPRDIASVWNLMNHLRPTLTGWSDRYDHLREVTRYDVIAILGELHRSRRSNVLVALRSLFAFCKKQGTIFRNRPGASRPASTPTASPSASARTTSTRPPEPPRPRQPGWCSCSPRSTPPAPAPSAPSSSTTSTWATAGSPSPDGSTRSTSSPTRSCPAGSATGAPAGQTPPARTCSSTSTRRWAPGQSARSTSPAPSSAARPRPWNGCASTGNSRKPSPTDPTAAPGSSIRPRPQDRHPLRRERQPAPHHQGRRARSRQFH